MARTQEVVVMDIGSYKIRMLVVARPNNGIFTVKKMVQIPYEGYCHGDWVDEKSTLSAIGTAISRIRDVCKIRTLYVSVPGEFCEVRTNNGTGTSFAKRHKIDKNDLENLFVKADPFAEDADKICINRSAIYYNIAGTSSKLVNPEGEVTTELTGYLSYIGADRRVIDFLTDCLVRNGIGEGNVRYTCGMYAEMMCLFDDSVRDKGPVVMVDAGYLSSTIAVIRGDGLMHMQSFSCGNGFFIAWLQEALDISFDAAGELYHNTDLSYQPRPEDMSTVKVKDADGNEVEMAWPMLKIQAYVRECIAAFAGYVKTALESFGDRYLTTNALYLTGGGLMIRGADDCFGKKVGHSFIQWATPAACCPEYKASCFADCIGIAHYAFAQEDKKRFLFR